MAPDRLTKTNHNSNIILFVHCMDWTEIDARVFICFFFYLIILLAFYMNWLFSIFSRKPFQLTVPMIVYNLIIATLNGYIASELFISSTRLKYNYVCQPCNQTNDPDELRVNLNPTNAFFFCEINIFIFCFR